MTVDYDLKVIRVVIPQNPEPESPDRRRPTHELVPFLVEKFQIGHYTPQDFAEMTGWTLAHHPELEQQVPTSVESKLFGVYTVEIAK